MRKLICLCLTLLLTLGVLCAHAEPADLTGDWALDYFGIPMYVFLYGDGTMEMIFAQEDVAAADDGSNSMTGTWEFDGATLILRNENGDTAFAWDEASQTLTCDYEGAQMVMYRPIEPETNEDIAPIGGMLAGGWTVAEDAAVTPELNSLLQRGLDSIESGMITVSYTPVAYLGSQVVAGTNHAILCRAHEINAARTWVIVYLYENLESDVTVLNIADLALGV